MGDIVTRTIDVYRDDPVWSRHARWFNIPAADLNALHIVRYTIQAEWIDQVDVERHAAEVGALHPGCILVY
jgi:hypothetical protein